MIERLKTDRRFFRGAAILVTLIGIVIRLPGLTAPIADRQSWNQCSTATVIRNFALRDFDLLHPQWDVLDPGTAAPNIEAEEAPIYSGVSALLYRIFGATHAIPRLLSILAMVVGGLFLLRLTARLFDPASAVFALLIWHVGPYPWFFGRTIMSDPWMLASLAAAADYFELWLRDDKTSDLYKAAFATCLAGLFKAFALHVGVLFLFAGIASRRIRFFADKRIYLFGAIALAAPLAWILYAAHIGSLGNVIVKQGDITGAPHLWGAWSMILRADFWLRIQSRIFDRSLTPIASALVIAGLLDRTTRRKSAYIWLWMLAALAYVLIVRSGNFEHNYYQLPFAAPMAILAGAGLVALGSKPKTKIGPDKLVVSVLVLFGLISVLYVRAEYRQDLSSVRAGEIAAGVTKPGDILLVLDPGVTRKNQVIYHADRRGWHLSHLTPEVVEKYRGWGADDVVICVSGDQEEQNAEAVAYLHKNYKLLAADAASGDGRPHKIFVFSLRTGPS